MKGAIAWFAGNHVAANLLMLFFIFGGLYSGLTMKVEVFPESSLDIILISVTYPGASPAEVEESMVRRIEEKVAGLAGIKRIDSTSREGYGTIKIEVMSGWSVQELLDDVKSTVDGMTTLPDEAEKPVIRDLTVRAQVINVAVYGDVPESTLKYITEKVRDDLTTLPGITLVEAFGNLPGEIHVEVSEETLRRYGLTLGAVALAIQKASLDLPAGSVKTKGGEILIRTKGRRYWASDYRDVALITRSDGSKVTLGQVAKITDGFQDLDIKTRFQGKPTNIVQVFRVADQNALTVAKTVKQYIEEIRPTLPAGVDIDFYADMSKMLKSRLELLLRNMAMGLILVSILLGVLLNLRLAFWVTLGIPISFLFGLMLLPEFDVTINMVSLFAFITVLGIVVDDAIIIGENVYRYQEAGLPPLKAAVEGAIEVGLPVIFSVLTTIVAFWPLLLGSGMMGRIMRNMPWVVILVLLGSLIESLLILPSHLAGGHEKAIERGRKRTNDNLVSRTLKWFISGPYARALAFCLRWRYAVVATGVTIILLSTGVYTSGWLKFTFFPNVESDVLNCTLTMPSGTPLERTIEVVQHLENSAREALGELDKQRPPDAPPLFQQSISLTGLQMDNRGRSGENGAHLAQVWIQILDGEQRSMKAKDITKAWREKIGQIPDAESVTFQSAIFHAGSPVEVHMSMDDTEQLLEAADELKADLEQIPGVFDVSDSFLPGKEEMQLKLKPAARSLGLTLSDLAQQVRHAFYGAEALRLLRDKDEVKVMVRYPEEERRSLNYVEEMRIRLPDGTEIPFGQVAEVNMEQGYSSIERSQRLRVIKVTADVDESISNANEVRAYVEKEFLPKLKDKHLGLRYTIEGEGREQKESLADVYRGFALALFCIYALLAVPFRSFTQPFIVMFAIPFGLAGAVIGHILLGFNLSLLSLFGMVGLAGVVVNDSLVLIDAANRRRRKGMTAYEAVTAAGQIRFRAIVLTSLTTFAGLSPMMVEKSLQAQFLIPMAISLGFGVLFSTLVTLLLIPCGYIILDDIHSRINRLLKRPDKTKAPRGMEGWEETELQPSGDSSK